MSVEPKKWGVIYNPKAGTRKVKKRWKEIKEYMDSKGVDYDYVQSEGFGSVERLAKILANNGYRTIVVVGGDGALNDAINGIMLSDAEDKDNIALGMIPNGIGNDFAKYWGLSTEYKPAVDCIINHRLKKIDVGYCNFYDGKEHQRRYFLNAVNIGLGARIVKITDQTKRFWGVKFLSYVAALFSLIFERKLYRMHLRINDEHIRGRIMTVCVGSAWGWGQTPSAVPYNGWLDVLLESRAEEIALNRCTFAREGIWAQPPEGKVDDRFVTGFLHLIRIALYGYKSLLEFLPGRAGRSIRFLISLLPRIPRGAASNTISIS